MKFKELSKESIDKKEKNLVNFWKEMNLLEKSVDSRDPENEFIFYDGPPTANGMPGIHHVISRTLKDITCRYKTMQGYRVLRKAGWDTHGLPVEIEVEKQLGLESKKEIEEYGVQEFNEKCKQSVFKYEKKWREMTDRMAYLIDLDDPYITLDNNYIESVWWLLDQMYKKGLVYKGAKILPYCPRCGTGLASHEVAQGYENIKTTTATVAFKRKDKDEYFLAWTTTPWTLPSNVALTVHPEFDYVLCESKNSRFWVEKSLSKTIFKDEYVILEEVKGKDLEYIEYEQLLPFFTVDKKAFYITCNDYVTNEDGTGIVHTAPSFGEDDYNTGRKYDLPLLCPVNEEGKFTGGPWEGINVMEADPAILDYLKAHGLLFSKQKFDHNYPHCWRCHTPLIYYPKPSWYIETTKIQKEMIKNNESVKWYPSHIGEGRFGNWLENLKDWAISRSRYWGTPINIWKCDDCGHTETVGSREELVQRAQEKIEPDIELHRPYVDGVHLTCPHCGGTMTREPDVIDVWFDSGAMPFAQRHYPFENKEQFFEKYFPADFICEGIDQTRGWFYSLLAISTMITGQAPYKNVLVNDLVLDKDGKKMSKSKGNTLDPFALFDQYGADVVRFYSIYVSPPWVPTKFDIDGLKEVESKFFRSFRNVYNFFSMYANNDEIDPREFFIPYADRLEIDRWILSRYHHLLQNYYKNMEQFDYTKVVKEISYFVIEDLSNWYIRRNRRRFWRSELDDDKRAVYNTTYEILLGLCKITAPIAPFISEEIYQVLSGKEESVHLEQFDECIESCFDNSLEEKMDLVRLVVTLGRAAREKAEIKVRQPISKIILDQKLEGSLYHFSDLIKEELNVKQIEFRKDYAEFMNFELKPDFKKVGKILGKHVPALQKFLSNVNAVEFLDLFNKQDSVEVDLGGDKIAIFKDYLYTRVNAKEGFDVEMQDNVFVILDTKLTDDLIYEGLARELISKIQQLRKSSGFDILDHIRMEICPTEAVQKSVEAYDEYIKEETLCDELIIDESLDGADFDLNGEIVKIKIKRLK